MTEKMKKKKTTLPLEAILRTIEAFSLSTGIDACFFGEDGAVRWTDTGCPGSAFCQTLYGCDIGKLRCMSSHRDAGQNALRLGEAYVSRCHAGLVFITVPLIIGEKYIGGLSCQPAMMWEWDEVAVQEIMQRTKDIPVAAEVLLAQSKDIPVLTTRRIRALGDLLYATAAHLSGGENEKLVEGRERSRQQMRLADIVMEQKRADDENETIRVLEGRSSSSYPLHMEHELLGKVRLGDRAGARGILNDMLGHIFYRTAGNIDVMKARILELVIMISRAAVESGAELEKLLGLNYNFIADLSGLTVYEDICLWVVKVLDAFMDTVYATRNVRNSRFLSEALSFIREQYMNNLTLDDVAGQVHISPFYLSHIFKEELGITFIEYLTRVRVEEAKKLLTRTELSMAQIAASVGYEDASYFSKVFKKVTGGTPNKFRKGG